jgi:hypothetical protein
MSPGQGPHEQTLRAAVEHFNDTLAQLLADPEFPIPDFWAEDVELVNFEPSPFPGTYRGHDGLRRWTEGRSSASANYSLSPKSRFWSQISPQIAGSRRNLALTASSPAQ